MSKTHFIPQKKGACGVRTGLKKKETLINKLICLQKLILSEKKRLRRTHRPQTQKIVKKQRCLLQKNEFYPKTSACGVRTGLKNKTN